MPPVAHLQLPAQRISSATSFQKGIVLLRGHYAAFLPTRSPTFMLNEVVKAGAGVTTIYKDGTWSFHAAAAEGPGAFDEAVIGAAIEHGLLFQRGDGTERVGALSGDKPLVAGNRLTLLRRGEDQVTIQAKPAQDLTRWLSDWPAGQPLWEGRKLAKIFAVLSSVPAVFALICVGAAIFGDDWTVVFGGCFWGALVVFVWGAYLVAWRRAKKNGHLGA